MSALAVIGAIKGDVDWYLRTIQSYKSSVQLGTFGDLTAQDYFLIAAIHRRLNLKNHKWLLGVEDEILALELPHSKLYGINEEYNCYYISGGDVPILPRKHLRYSIAGNELSQKELEIVKQEIAFYRPTAIVSHHPPESIVSKLDKVSNENSYVSFTNLALEEILQKYPPKKWICTHYDMMASLRDDEKDVDFKILGPKQIYELK
jgi:hypothetical protein